MLQEIFKSLSSMGYFGIFLINLIGYSTIFFPLPSTAFVFAAAAFLNPLILGLAGGLGATLGELTGYFLGVGGRKLILKKRINEKMERAINFFQSRGTFYAIVFLAATPLPDDILGVSAGFLKYDLKKFLLASLIGKVILHLVIAYAGFFGINWLKSIFLNGF